MAFLSISALLCAIPVIVQGITVVIQNQFRITNPDPQFWDRPFSQPSRATWIPGAYQSIARTFQQTKIDMQS